MTVAFTAVTIYDRSRIGAVRVLARTLAEHHPDARMLALFVGADEAPAIDGADAITLEALVPDGSWWPRVAGTEAPFRDGVLLPFVLAHAASNEPGAPVVALDAQMRVTAPLTALLEQAATAGTVFVPMAGGRLPDGEDLVPDAAWVDAAGSVNRRVFAVTPGPALDALLEGWPEYGITEVAGRPPELIADAVQRHLDRHATAPGADVRVLADRGTGVAYWNLPLREVAGSGAALTAGGDRIALLDLAGFEYETPDAPWPVQNRVRLSQSPELAAVLRRHAEEVLELAPGRPALPYTADWHGRPLDVTLRELIRRAVAEGALQDPPWSVEGTRQLDAWLDEPAERGAAVGLTRYHLAIWEARVDLRAAYPHLDGPDGPGYAEWLHAYGTKDHHIPVRSLPPEEHAGPPQSEPETLPWGANVAGFFRSELGLGEAARLLIGGLDAAKVPALPVQGALVPPCRQEAEFTFTTPGESPYPINIICMNGDTIPVFAREADERFFKDRHTIALWWWEIVDAFPPDWHEAFEYVDEVWVATDHILEAIAPHSPKPVLKVPMPVTMPRLQPFTREAVGFPEDGFVFLYIYDYHSTAARKNPLGHIEAFKRAFRPGEGAKLVLKCINAENLPEHHERTLLAIGDHPDITVIDRYVSADAKNGMLANADCYVSLHRSEGFGLTPAEAMLLGKPVIATRYGGTLEFMNDENSFLVDHGWTTVGRGAHPYPPDATWAEPDLDHAAKLMREVFDDPDEAQRRGAAAKRYMVAHHAPHVAGAAMRRRLENVYDGLSAAAEPAPGPGLPDLHHTGDRIGGGLPVPAGRAAAVKKPVRNVTGRVMSPWLARQKSIDEGLLRSLDALYGELDRVQHELVERTETELREERTQTMAALRRVRAELGDHERWLIGVEHQLAVQAEQIAELRRLAEPAAQLRALPYMEEPFERWTDPQAGAVEGFTKGIGVEAAGTAEAYRRFEDRFRGSRERITALQQAFVPLLADHGPVLDVGCGRGELLEVLGEAGIEARGVDTDGGMLAIARVNGVTNVEEADAVEVLKNAEAGSLGAVVAMQVIEHLPYEALQELLLAARHALRAGGRLIVETVNPHAVAAMKGFWLDPTHQHPLFPEVTLELVQEAGFDRGFVFFPNGAGDVEADRLRQPAYAVVADVAGDASART
jgi:glycosyltransferase involved in cell wall biosynthesis/SAM-dependent methyltransferase